jgi:TetR/AcrR family transcriptional regulator, mexJK operon transcriptional repressor
MELRRSTGSRSPASAGAAAGARQPKEATESTDPVARGAAARSRRAPRLASGGAIREAAAALFLERGYQGTSLDEIAAAAKISKQTIYTHFANKEELFADLVLGNAERVDEFVTTMLRAFNAGSDVASGLRELARLYIRFLVRPEVLRLRRLVIAEAGRYPALARTYYERVPQRVYSALAALFHELSDQGRLQVEDPVLAAHHFAWLTIGTQLDQGMFFDPGTTKAGADLDRSADAAVRVFLAAYAPQK